MKNSVTGFEKQASCSIMVSVDRNVKSKQKTPTFIRAGVRMVDGRRLPQ